LGVLVVLAASAAVAASTQVPVTLTVGTIALSLGSAGLAGALAGLYPARRAAHVDIAQAVRAD
jgi:ABC-type antimicrobial peptide transport system permease subunit